MRTASVTAAVLIVALTGAPEAAGDTIVLKNGRRIVALAVVEEGEKVRYQTAAGELTLPKSIVDHVERSGPPMQEKPDGMGGRLPLAPPSMDLGASDSNVEQRTVHDGFIDRNFLADVANEARSGTAAASERAARAYHAAARFELAQGDVQHGLADERSALSYTPENLILLLSLAYIHLRQSEYKSALDYLERARRVAPDNADEAKLEGWAYYGMNKLERAVAEWTRAFALRADPDVKAALDKAKRDKQEEENYKENESSHFVLRYSGGAQPELSREILRALEVHFSSIAAELNYEPPEPIGVILYTGQTFADITRAPNWAGALNDGRIRVPVQGLTTLTPELSRVLKHELTHSFIRQKTRGYAPTWIQEGLAQWMEGARSNATASLLVEVYDAKKAISLGELEGPWLRLPKEIADYAYAWALANVQYIIQADGMGDVERILDRIGGGMSTGTALREVLHSDYNDLMKDTAGYLRKQYVH
jgi:hypothetical protein